MYGISKKKDTAPPLVLVIEDNAMDRKIIRRALSGWTVRIEEAVDGDEGLARASDGSPDLILLDVKLPGMDGYEVCRQLKRSPQTIDIPVIFITSLTQQEDLVRGFEAGAVDYIRKPFNVVELKARVGVQIELKRREDALRHSLDELHLLKQSIEAVSSGVTISDYDGNIVYTNPAEARMHGYELGELIGRHVSVFSRKSAGKMPEPSQLKDAEWIREVMNVRKDGTDFPVRIKSSFLYDSQGLPANRIAIVEDITEQKRAQSEIQKYLERIETSKVELENAHEELRLANIETIYVLTRIAEYRDADTAEHIKRIGLYARIMADYLGLDSSFCELMMYAAPMHDVGKIGIPDALLLKNGPLTGHEFLVMKQHTTIGSTLLRTNHRNPILELASEIAHAHHERWDGTGYPMGINGEKIPLSARITMLADHYDALRSKRPYRQGLEHKEAAEIILKGDARTKPTHFDPELLSKFEKLQSDFDDIFNDFSLDVS